MMDFLVSPVHRAKRNHYQLHGWRGGAGLFLYHRGCGSGFCLVCNRHSSWRDSRKWRCWQLWKDGSCSWLRDDYKFVGQSVQKHVSVRALLSPMDAVERSNQERAKRWTKEAKVGEGTYAVVYRGPSRYWVARHVRTPE